jgi:hypothetical protein
LYGGITEFVGGGQVGYNVSPATFYLALKAISMVPAST